MSERPKPTVTDEQVRKRFDEIIRVGIPVDLRHPSRKDQPYTLVTGSQLVAKAAQEIAENRLEIPDEENFMALRVSPAISVASARSAVLTIAGSVIKFFDRPLTHVQRNRHMRNKPPGK